MTEPPGGRPDELDSGMVRTMRIVALATAAGPTVFLVIALIVRAGGQGVLAADPWSLAPRGAGISLVALLVAASLTAGSFVAPPAVAAGLRRQIASGRSVAGATGHPPLAVAWLNQVIVGLALLEGAALFNLIAFLIEGRAPTLIAAVALIVLMLTRFPREDAVREWIEDQAAKLREDRAS